MWSRYAATGLIVLFCLSGQAAFAWSTVGTGIEYQKYTLSDPNNVYVARMARIQTAATIESTLPQGKLTNAKETVRAQSNRLEGAINWWGESWGQRNDVVIAVNADFTDVNTGALLGGQFYSGWYVKQMYGAGIGGTQFTWTLDRTTFLCDCMLNASDSLSVVFPSTQQTVNGINRLRNANELVLYTPQYDGVTPTDNSGTEVVVEMTKPNMALASPGYVIGHIKQIRQNQGATPIPFDCIVLSATGTAATALLANSSVGAEVHIVQHITTYDANCASPGSTLWSRAYTSVHGNCIVLRNGVTDGNAYDPTMSNRNPRTAVAYSNDYVFFVVCDGRSGASRGMTGAELGDFCKNTLGATYALNLDGGGSSTMVVNGSVVNVPSDGSERSIGNCLMMVNLQPKMQNTTYCTGQFIASAGSYSLRVGPGTNYAVQTTLTNGQVGNVVAHSLNGVYATGYYWWKGQFGATTGWVAEGGLTPYGAIAPSVTQQPVAQTFCPGSVATYTVSATGSGLLTYQWQKDGVNLANGGKYSGVTTSTLTVTGCSSAEAGTYRCKVTNSWGTAYSDGATLSLSSMPEATISSPSPLLTKSGPVTFTVTYTNADVITLSAADIQVQRSGTATGFIAISGSGNTRTVTISGITGYGTLSGYLAAGTASNGCGIAGAAGPSPAFTVDNTAPTGSVTINGDAQYTNSTSVTLTLTGSDPSGVSRMCFRNSTSDPWSNWEPFATSKTWTIAPGDGLKRVDVMLEDGAGNTASPYDTITLDSTAPVLSGPPTDAGTYSDNTSVVFNWPAASDPGSGIAGYNCCIGTSPGGSDVMNGTLGNVLSTSITGSYGKVYYCKVQARDNAGNTSAWSANSDGIAVVQHSGVDISAAKELADQSSVGMSMKAVSAIFADCFYVQDAGGVSGIRISPAVMPSGLSVGSLVDIAGTLRVSSSGERYVDGIVVVH